MAQEIGEMRPQMAVEIEQRPTTIHAVQRLVLLEAQAIGRRQVWTIGAAWSLAAPVGTEAVGGHDPGQRTKQPLIAAIEEGPCHGSVRQAQQDGLALRQLNGQKLAQVPGQVVQRLRTEQQQHGFFMGLSHEELEDRPGRLLNRHQQR